MDQTLACELCSAASHLKFCVSDYIKHLKLFHAHQPNFKVTCRIGGCQRNYSNLGTFQNHVYAVHSEDLIDVSTETILVNSTEDDGNDFSDVTDSDNDEPCCEDSVETDNNQECSSESSMQKSSALFLLGIKEKFKLTQSSIDGIVQGVTAMNQQHISILKSQVHVIMHCLCS